MDLPNVDNRSLSTQSTPSVESIPQVAENFSNFSPFSKSQDQAVTSTSSGASSPKCDARQLSSHSPTSTNSASQDQENILSKVFEAAKAGDLAKVQALVAPLMPLNSTMTTSQTTGSANQSNSTHLNFPSSLSESITSMISGLTNNPPQIFTSALGSTETAQLSGSSSYLSSLPTTSQVMSITTLGAELTTSMHTSETGFVHQLDSAGIQTYTSQANTHSLNHRHSVSMLPPTRTTSTPPIIDSKSVGHQSIPSTADTSGLLGSLPPPTTVMNQPTNTSDMMYFPTANGHLLAMASSNAHVGNSIYNKSLPSSVFPIENASCSSSTLAPICMQPDTSMIISTSTAINNASNLPPPTTLPPFISISLNTVNAAGEFNQVQLTLPNVPTVILQVLPLVGAQIGEQISLNVSTQQILNGISNAMANGGTLNGGPILLQIAPPPLLPLSSGQIMTTMTNAISTLPDLSKPVTIISATNNMKLVSTAPSPVTTILASGGRKMRLIAPRPSNVRTNAPLTSIGGIVMRSAAKNSRRLVSNHASLLPLPEHSVSAQPLVNLPTSSMNYAKQVGQSSLQPTLMRKPSTGSPVMTSTFSVTASSFRNRNKRKQQQSFTSNINQPTTTTTFTSIMPSSGFVMGRTGDLNSYPTTMSTDGLTSFVTLNQPYISGNTGTPITSMAPMLLPSGQPGQFLFSRGAQSGPYYVDTSNTIIPMSMGGMSTATDKLNVDSTGLTDPSSEMMTYHPGFIMPNNNSADNTSLDGFNQSVIFTNGTNAGGGPFLLQNGGLFQPINSSVMSGTGGGQTVVRSASDYMSAFSQCSMIASQQPMVEFMQPSSGEIFLANDNSYVSYSGLVTDGSTLGQQTQPTTTIDIKEEDTNSDKDDIINIAMRVAYGVSGVPPLGNMDEPSEVVETTVDEHNASMDDTNGMIADFIHSYSQPDIITITTSASSLVDDTRINQISANETVSETALPCDQSTGDAKLDALLAEAALVGSVNGVGDDLSSVSVPVNSLHVPSTSTKNTDEENEYGVGAAIESAATNELSLQICSSSLNSSFMPDTTEFSQSLLDNLSSFDDPMLQENSSESFNLVSRSFVSSTFAVTDQLSMYTKSYSEETTNDLATVIGNASPNTAAVRDSFLKSFSMECEDIKLPTMPEFVELEEAKQDCEIKLEPHNINSNVLTPTASQNDVLDCNSPEVCDVNADSCDQDDVDNEDGNNAYDSTTADEQTHADMDNLFGQFESFRHQHNIQPGEYGDDPFMLSSFNMSSRDYTTTADQLNEALQLLASPVTSPAGFDYHVHLSRKPVEVKELIDDEPTSPARLDLTMSPAKSSPRAESLAIDPNYKEAPNSNLPPLLTANNSQSLDSSLDNTTHVTTTELSLYYEAGISKSPNSTELPSLSVQFATSLTEPAKDEDIIDSDSDNDDSGSELDFLPSHDNRIRLRQPAVSVSKPEEETEEIIVKSPKVEQRHNTKQNLKSPTLSTSPSSIMPMSPISLDGLRRSGRTSAGNRYNRPEQKSPKHSTPFIRTRSKESMVIHISSPQETIKSVRPTNTRSSSRRKSVSVAIELIARKNNDADHVLQRRRSQGDQISTPTSPRQLRSQDLNKLIKATNASSILTVLDSRDGDVTDESDISPVKSSSVGLNSLDQLLKSCQRRSGAGITGESNSTASSAVIQEVAESSSVSLATECMSFADMDAASEEEEKQVSPTPKRGRPPGSRRKQRSSTPRVDRSPVVLVEENNHIEVVEKQEQLPLQLNNLWTLQTGRPTSFGLSADTKLLLPLLPSSHSLPLAAEVDLKLPKFDTNVPFWSDTTQDQNFPSEQASHVSCASPESAVSTSVVSVNRNSRKRKHKSTENIINTSITTMTTNTTSSVTSEVQSPMTPTQPCELLASVTAVSLALTSPLAAAVLPLNLSKCDSAFSGAFAKFAESRALPSFSEISYSSESSFVVKTVQPEEHMSSSSSTQSSPAANDYTNWLQNPDQLSFSSSLFKPEFADPMKPSPLTIPISASASKETIDDVCVRPTVQTTNVLISPIKSQPTFGDFANPFQKLNILGDGGNHVRYGMTFGSYAGAAAFRAASFSSLADKVADGNTMSVFTSNSIPGAISFSEIAKAAEYSNLLSPVVSSWSPNPSAISSTITTMSSKNIVLQSFPLNSTTFLDKQLNNSEIVTAIGITTTSVTSQQKPDSSVISSPNRSTTKHRRRKSRIRPPPKRFANRNNDDSPPPNPSPPLLSPSPSSPPPLNHEVELVLVDEEEICSNYLFQMEEISLNWNTILSCLSSKAPVCCVATVNNAPEIFKFRSSEEVEIIDLLPPDEEVIQDDESVSNDVETVVDEFVSHEAEVVPVVNTNRLEEPESRTPIRLTLKLPFINSKESNRYIHRGYRKSHRKGAKKGQRTKRILRLTDTLANSADNLLPPTKIRLSRIGDGFFRSLDTGPPLPQPKSALVVTSQESSQPIKATQFTPAPVNTLSSSMLIDKRPIWAARGKRGRGIGKSHKRGAFSRFPAHPVSIVSPKSTVSNVLSKKFFSTSKEDRRSSAIKMVRPWRPGGFGGLSSPRKRGALGGGRSDRGGGDSTSTHRITLNNQILGSDTQSSAAEGPSTTPVDNTILPRRGRGRGRGRGKLCGSASPPLRLIIRFPPQNSQTKKPDEEGEQEREDDEVDANDQEIQGGACPSASISSSAASSPVSYVSSSAADAEIDNGVIFYTAPEAEAFVDLNQAPIRRVRNVGEGGGCGSDMNPDDTNGGGDGGCDEGESSSPSSAASQSSMHNNKPVVNSNHPSQSQATLTKSYKTCVLQNASQPLSAVADKQQQHVGRLEWEPVEQNPINSKVYTSQHSVYREDPSRAPQSNESKKIFSPLRCDMSSNIHKESTLEQQQNHSCFTQHQQLNSNQPGVEVTSSTSARSSSTTSSLSLIPPPSTISPPHSISLTTNPDSHTTTDRSDYESTHLDHQQHNHQKQRVIDVASSCATDAGGRQAYLKSDCAQLNDPKASIYNIAQQAHAPNQHQLSVPDAITMTATDDDAKQQQAIVAATAYAAAAAAGLEPMASQMRAYCDQWASSFLDNLQQPSTGTNEEAQRLAYNQWKVHQQQAAATQHRQQPAFPPAAVYGQHQQSVYEQQIRTNEAHQQNAHAHKNSVFPESCSHQNDGDGLAAGFNRYAWCEADRLNSDSYYQTQQSQQQQHWLNNYQQLTCRNQQPISYQPSLSSSHQQNLQQHQLQHANYGRVIPESANSQPPSSAAAAAAMFQSFTGLS